MTPLTIAAHPREAEGDEPGNALHALIGAADVFILPASVEQHRYWILDQVDKESTASNMAIAFRLEGRLDDHAVEQTVRALTLRHEALRTTYRMIDGELSQIIGDTPLYSFSVTDLRELSPEEAGAHAEEVLHDFGRVHMNLAEGPLFFMRLIHCTDALHFLACTVHHIACDGWSNGVVVRDFAEIYSALIEHREPRLPQLPFQFADFSLWQRDWLASDEASAALAFWKQQIQRGAAAVDLPVDRPRSARKDAPGHVESQLMSATLHAELKAFCRRRQATMHQVLLAAFQAHIARYTRQTEFLLGSSIANRTQPGMDDVVGRFANPQVVIADVTGDPSFQQLLKRVTEWSGQAYAHQDLPFSRLMEEFQLDQSGATSQFLQVYFVYQKAFMQPQQAGSLQIVPRPSLSGGVNFDMLVSVVERAEGPRLQIEYNTEIFNRGRIQLFMRRYLQLLEAVLANDALPVSQLPVLLPDEAAALEKLGSAPATAEPFTGNLLEAFDRHAEHLGDAPAFVLGEQRTSWRALEAASRDLAPRLTALGLCAGQHVILEVGSSPDAVAAALAILRLGGTIVPVPPTCSQLEWDGLLTQLQPALAIRSAADYEALRSASPQTLPTPPVSPEAPAAALLQIDASDHFRLHPVSHLETARSLQAAAHLLQARPGDAILLLPSHTSADAWVDLMLPLVSGLCVVHTPDVAAKDVQGIIDREQVSLALGTPSEWTQLLAAGWRGDRRLRVICRGERFTFAVAERLRGSGRLWQATTSPQAGGLVGLVPVPANETRDWPIAPLPASPLKVADVTGQTVPGEVFGELIAGTRPTGLLARCLPAQGFEIVDTCDHERRLYNYRLRLGDLEDRLLNRPGVLAVRAAVDTLSKDPSLIVCVVAQPDSPVTAEALRQHLRQTAPGHLSGAKIRLVSTLPLRVDGSLDLTAVPGGAAAQATSPTHTAEFLAPRDEIETRLVRIWEDVLGIPGIGVRTNFFTLGGYSLMIVRLFARINKAFGSSLPITTIFNAPTVEQLADILRGRRDFSALVPVQKGNGLPPFFLIHSYLLYAGLCHAMGPDYPFYGLTELEVDGEMTIEQRVTGYIREIRRTQPKGPYFIGGWCAAGPLAVEAARQLLDQGETVGLLVLFDSWRPSYMEELSTQPTGSRTKAAIRIRRKAQYHLQRTAKLTPGAKLRYLTAQIMHKIRSTRDQLYLKNWAAVQWLVKRFGLPMPAFMNNISLETLNSVRLYQAPAIACRMALLRATDSVIVDGAEDACGWSRVATHGVDVYWAPGSHESMFMEPNITVVGQMVRDALNTARLNSH